ncbi:hypothetical protein BDW02DRAFT_620937 [Decorospora gaudefroyi]|uniref:Uncharacterized protein n=1 Tax=Decorospora gaudefroyi TaxID=184978 RepID=A0A6A5JXJ1_9PLEO|nr:hypothetical protein BDW02DRAFT_620937 [Decorospora gaudefroyi]
MYPLIPKIPNRSLLHFPILLSYQTSTNEQVPTMPAPQRPKKTVHFTQDTNFTPGRPLSQICRPHRRYIPGGKHSCPSPTGWLDTSLIDNLEHEILQLKVYAEFRVRDYDEMCALRTSIAALMGPDMDILSDPAIPLCFSAFRRQVPHRFREMRLGVGIDDISVDVMDAWRRAKMVVIYNADLSIIQPASSRGVGWLDGCFETPPAGRLGLIDYRGSSWLAWLDWLDAKLGNLYRMLSVEFQLSSHVSNPYKASISSSVIDAFAATSSSPPKPSFLYLLTH